MAIKSTKTEQKNVVEPERTETTVQERPTIKGATYEPANGSKDRSNGFCKKIRFKWVC